MTTTFQETTTPFAALEACGWQATDANCRTLDTPHGPACMKQVADSGGRLQFIVEGGRLTEFESDRICAENYRLFGPFKLVSSPAGRSICRADVPKEFPQHNTQRAWGSTALEGLTDADPRRSWAAAITAAVTGDFETLPQTPPPDETLVAQLKSFGWAVSLTARELQALRDRELAQLVLASTAGPSSKRR